MLVGILVQSLNNGNKSELLEEVLNENGIETKNETKKTISNNEDYYIKARLRQFSANGLQEIPFMKVCLAVSLKTKQPDLFEMNVTYAAVQYHWNKFGFFIHLFFCVLFTGYIACVFTLNILIHDTSHIDSGDLVIILITIVLSCVFLGFEFIQIVSNSANYYIFQYCTDYFVGWIAYILTLAGSILRYCYAKETKNSADVMAVATVFVFLKGLDYLRPFELTGPSIRIVYAILFQIIPLLGILAVIVVGFSQAFYLLSYNNPHLDSHGFGISIPFMYVYMTGQANWADMFDTTTPTLAIILMCIFVALTTILILNLIIATMNNVYSMVLSDAMGEWKREQCKLVIEYQTVISFLCCSDISKSGYFTILMRDDYAEERKREYLRKNCTVIMQRDIMELKKELCSLKRNYRG